MSLYLYQGAALCWDTTRLQLYTDACYVVSDDQKGVYNDYQYQCFGVAPHKFWENIAAGLPDPNACVCRFHSAAGNGVDGWTLFAIDGVCNGACTSPYFGCDGSVPIALDSPSERSMEVMQMPVLNSTTATVEGSASTASSLVSASHSVVGNVISQSSSAGSVRVGLHVLIVTVLLMVSGMIG